MRTPFSSVQFNSVQFNSVQFNSIQFIQFNSSQFKAIQVNSFNSIQISSIQFNSIQLNSIHSFILLFLSITNIRNTEVPSNFFWLSYLSYLIFSYLFLSYLYIHLSNYPPICVFTFLFIYQFLLCLTFSSRRILPVYPAYQEGELDQWHFLVDEVSYHNPAANNLQLTFSWWWMI